MEDNKYQIILTKLEGIENLTNHRLGAIENHLKQLNGQTAKNTAFRQQGTVYKSILAAVGIAVLGLIIDRLFV